MALGALFFDLDGTLVDTNSLHIEAWRRTFLSFDYKINPDRIAVEVGKGGDQLVPSILGKRADEKDGEDLRARQPEEFGKLAEERGIKVSPGAQDIFRELRRREIKTVLATSSNKKQLKTIERFCGVEWSKLVDKTVTADDIKKSKPHPDVVLVALDKLGICPAQCAMVGDTIWDIHSARGGGIVGVGVTCGGNSEISLYSAGARIVVDDVKSFHQKLDCNLERCSPGPVRLSNDLLTRLMREALSTAEEALRAGEAPIACVLARGDGSIIARGHNEQNRTQNKAAHAEIVTFAKASGKIPLDARDLLLVSTLEPCVMCTGAAMEAAVDTIVFGLRAPADNGSTRVQPPTSPECQMPRIIGDILADESRRLFKQFLASDPSPPQRAYVAQLLKSTG